QQRHALTLPKVTISGKNLAVSGVSVWLWWQVEARCVRLRRIVGLGRDVVVARDRRAHVAVWAGEGRGMPVHVVFAVREDDEAVWSQREGDRRARFAARELEASAPR